jgi:hypothetical protein
VSAQGTAAVVIVGICAAPIALIWAAGRGGRVPPEWERISIGALFAATAGACSRFPATSCPR